MKNDGRRVVITGMSVVAGNGKNRQEFLENCRKGISGLKPCTVFDTEKLRTPYFGQAPCSLPSEPDSWEKEDRMEALMDMAMMQAYDDAGWSRDQMESLGRRACLCLGTLLAVNEKILAFAKREASGQDTSGWLSHTVAYGPWIRKRSGVKGGLYIDSAACASGTTAAGMAFDFIRNGLYDAALVGGADPLTEVAAFGFHALQSLSQGICRPFDKERDGINIGEGAAFFILETLESARSRGAHIYGEILGYGLNNDAYHITSPDPEGAGAVQSMRTALAMGNVSLEQVDYVNAHGTGTAANDAMETKALQTVFAGRKEPLWANSTKALVGHCMGASGAVELAAVLLAMETGCIFPMPDLKNPMEMPDYLLAAKEGEEGEKVQYALSNSFAFAGNTASLLLKKMPPEPKEA